MRKAAIDHTARLSQLIGDVYDAALDPAHWVDVLEKTARFVGGPAASLVSKDAASKTGEFAYQAGLDPAYVRLYFDKYIRLDPNTTGQVLAKIEEPVSVADFLPYDEFLETRFFQEWARPQGLIDAVSSVLERSTTSAALVLVFRHERDGLVDDETRRRMRLIVPHIRRAALIGKVIDLKKAEAATLADALDGISAGMFLVDASGCIMHANAAGHAMLEKGDLLRAAGGRLVANAPETGQILADIFASADQGDAAIGMKGVALPLKARNDEPYVAHVLPLTSGERWSAATSYRAVAALFVHRAALDRPSPPEAIATAYKLTPMELRALLALVEIGGVAEVAEALGIAVTTVKTHLGHVYEKTGARRHADLVKLVAGFSNPLFG
jgi:DNA-binding CsgD family transcriptional regulator/PAS domain-containing protein